MKFCYVDESGCTSVLPSSTSDIQPIFAIIGLIFDADNLGTVTENFLDAKRRFFPATAGKASYLDAIMKEIKGSEIRKHAASSSRRQRTHSIGFLDHVLAIVEQHNMKIVGRIWIKGIGDQFDGRAIYTFSMQEIYNGFQHYLEECDDVGVVIADSRWYTVNRSVSHSIFTKKFKRGGDAYARVLELPAFAHSDNHVGLQVCDMICSAVATPLAVHTYCAGRLTSVHVRPGYQVLKSRYANRLRSLQYRYDVNGRRRGGLTVSDALGQQPGSMLFQ